MKLEERAIDNATSFQPGFVMRPPANFVREVTGMDYGLWVNASQGIFVSERFDGFDALPGANSSYWTLHFPRAGVSGEIFGYEDRTILYANRTDPYPYLEFQFNGIGVDLAIQTYGLVKSLEPKKKPEVTVVSSESYAETIPVSVHWVPSMLRWLVTSDVTQATQKQWKVTVMIPPDTYSKLGPIRLYYNLPLAQGEKLVMTEFDPSASYLGGDSPLITPAVVTRGNDTWLSDALNSSGSGQIQLNSSTAHVVALPPNISFVSVLGQRSLRQGDSGECRVVFDPPLDSGWTPHTSNPKAMPQRYINVPSGNPDAVKVWYASSWDQSVDEKASIINGQPGPLGSWTGHVNYTHLLDWQLDPSIRYKLAIVNASTPSLDDQGPAQQALPNGTCNFNLLQLWKAVPDPNATEGNASAAGSTTLAGADPAATSTHKGISGSTIAATVIGIVLGLLLLGGLAAWLFRRWRRNHASSDDLDLDGEIQDDTAVVAHAPAPRADSVEDLAGIAGERKEPRDRGTSNRRERIVHHEEDVGALSDDDDGGVDVDILPPVYREEWIESGNRRQRRRPTGPRPSRTPSISRMHEVTPEEIKYLGQPVTTRAPSSSQVHGDFTSEELKYLGHPGSSGSPAASAEETSGAETPEPLLKDTSDAPPADKTSDEEPKRKMLSWKQKGKRVMDGEKSPLP